MGEGRCARGTLDFFFLLSITITDYSLFPLFDGGKVPADTCVLSSPLTPVCVAYIEHNLLLSPACMAFARELACRRSKRSPP